MPPERGNSTASSAIVSAPNSTTSAPTIHSSAIAPTEPTCSATVLGTRKIPLPIVDPTRTAAALQIPSRRGSRS